jgi:hypothetical protein
MTPDQAVALARDLLQQPVGEAYPLPNRWSGERWQKESLEALEAAVLQGDLDDVSVGVPLPDALHLLATAPLGARLDEIPGRVRLLGDAIQHIADPGRINQGYKGTCAVTCVEIFVAARYPAEYIRLVAGLASPAGVVTLRNGEPLRRDEEVLTWSGMEARRSPVSRLLQVAFMEFAYPDLDYQNMVDGHIERGAQGDKNTGTGVGLDEFDRLLEAVTNERWDTLSEHQSKLAEKFARLGIDTSFMPDLYRDGMAIIRNALAAKDAVFVTLGSRGADERVGENPLLALPHKVRVIKIDDETGRVHYDDPLDPEHPWMPGVVTQVETDDGECSMACVDFEELCCEVSYRPVHAEGVVPAKA